MADDDDDDYLSMTFEQPTQAKETLLQRTARLKREAAARGRPLSKAEQAAKAEHTRKVGLATKLDESNNKGARLMAKMGYKGSALGAEGNEGRLVPIELEFREGRGGIGVDSEKKRKIREEAEAQESTQKKVKLTEAEYRDRNAQELEDKRAEGQWWSAMRTLEGLEEGDDAGVNHKPLSKINLLYRPLVKDRRTKEQARQDMKSIYDDRKLRPIYDDPDMDADDKLAINDDHEELDADDEELESYVESSPTQRLDTILNHLRTTYNYCFWCKYTYPDAELDGCPGPSEDEHG